MACSCIKVTLKAAHFLRKRRTAEGKMHNEGFNTDIELSKVQVSACLWRARSSSLRVGSICNDTTRKEEKYEQTRLASISLCI